MQKNTSPIETIVDVSTLKVKQQNFSPKQLSYAHLIDPRFFPGGVNPFRKGRSDEDFGYETPIDLDEELFYLHPLMDPSVLEQGAVRRFPAGVNEKYISEKYFEDRWVSEGNNALADFLEEYVRENYSTFATQKRIRLLDVGPCGGAITTLFALRAFDRLGLLEKVHITLLDIVPNVLEATLLGRFQVPQAMLEEYGLVYAGRDAARYRDLLGDGVLYGVEEWYREHQKSAYADEALERSRRVSMRASFPRVQYVRGDGERLPEDIMGSFDVVLSAYTHHHMNLFGRKSLCEQMEAAVRKDGFIGIADFFVPSYQAYMEWYRPHFSAYGDAPPVECPLVDATTLQGWLRKTAIRWQREDLFRTFVFAGVRL